MGLLDTIYDVCHCTLVLRIWRMVGEMPVRLGKKAARRVRAEGYEHILFKEAARAVARVYYYAHAFKRPLLVYAAAYRAHKLRRVYAHEVYLFRSEGRIRAVGIKRFGNGEYLLYVRLFKAALGREKLEAVALIGQMACRGHNGAVEHKAFGNGRHKHGGRCGKARVTNAYPFRVQRRAEHLAGKAGIPPHAHADIGFIKLCLQHARKGTAYCIRRIRRKVNAPAAFGLYRNAANIAAVLQFCKLHIHPPIKKAGDAPPVILLFIQGRTAACTAALWY